MTRSTRPTRLPRPQPRGCLIIVRDAALIDQIPRWTSTSLVKPFRARVSYVHNKLVETLRSPAAGSMIFFGVGALQHKVLVASKFGVSFN